MSLHFAPIHFVSGIIAPRVNNPLFLTTPSSLIMNATPLDGSASANESASASASASERISSLIDQITSAIGEAKQISIDEILTRLNNLHSSFKTLDENLVMFDIYTFKKENELAVNLVLLYTSTYPATPTTVALDVNMLKKFPMTTPQSTQSNPVTIPSLLKPIETRTNSTDVQERFLQLQANRLSNFKVKVQVKGQGQGQGQVKGGHKAEQEQEQQKEETYMVRREDIIHKTEELMELFTTFKDIEKISHMIHRIKEMRMQAVKTAKTKNEAYQKIKAMKDSLINWEKQSKHIYKGIAVINEETACNPQTNADIESIDTAFSCSIASVINQLPIERIANELNLSHSILKICNTLSQPFFNHSNSKLIECPVCLSEVDDNVYTIILCGHLLCGECLNRLDTCPVCRIRYTPTQTLKIFTKL